MPTRSIPSSSSQSPATVRSSSLRGACVDRGEAWVLVHLLDSRLIGFCRIAGSRLRNAGRRGAGVREVQACDEVPGRDDDLGKPAGQHTPEGLAALAGPNAVSEILLSLGSQRGRHRCVDRHPDLLPHVPVHRHDEGNSGPSLARSGERIQARVGAAVVGLAHGAEHPRDGRAQHDEIRRVLGQERRERRGPGHLGREHLGRGLPGSQLDHPASGQAGGMDDAVDPAEARPGGGQRRPHLLHVGDVRRQDQDLRAQGLQGLDLPHATSRSILRRVTLEPGRPGVARWQLRACRQDQLPRRRPGQEFSQRQPDPAEAARDEIHAMAPETRRRLPR